MSNEMVKATLFSHGDSISFYGEYAEKVKAAFERIGVSITVKDKICEECAPDIMIGVDDESISAVAAAVSAKNAVESDSYFKPKFAAVASNGKIALVYDRNEYTALQGGEIAVELLLDKITESGAVKYSDGLIISGTVDLIERQKEIDAGTKREKWDDFKRAIADKYGDEYCERLYSAFEDFYAIFKDTLVEWCASLYDPDIGGFYASTSGKKYFGCLPLVEYTYRGLVQMENFGVFPGEWYESLPKKILYRIGYFAKSCQDPNGFFYHPQMVKAVTDASLNSRGRNMGTGMAILDGLGMKPTYPTPNDDPYDGITADEWWDNMVKEGKIPADEVRPFVPKSLYDYELWLAGKPTFKTKDEAMEHEKVEIETGNSTPGVSTAKSNEYLESHAGYSAYLDSKNIDNNPYYVASELNGTYRLIKSASDRLGKCTDEGYWYTGMTLCDMTIDWFNRHINEKGLFGKITNQRDANGDPVYDGFFEGTGYQNTNGLMKAIPIYNDWGVEYPAPLLAAKGCLEGIISPAPSVGNICETYNIWSAFSGIIANVKKYAPDDVREETLAEIRRALGEIGPDAIVNCYVKQARYQKPDGGFGHNIYKGNDFYQGYVRVGMGVNEANTDANGFGSASIIRAMLSCFELGKYMPPLYYTWNYMKYLDIILNMKSTVKEHFVPEESTK